MKTRRSSPERGQELVEFALTFPILILVLMAIVDFGRAIYYYSAIHNAAREGARRGIISQSAFEATAVVLDRAIGVKLQDDDVTVTFLDDDQVRPGNPNNDNDTVNNDYIEVGVVYRFAPVTPLLRPLLRLAPGQFIQLRTTATMQVEG